MILRILNVAAIAFSANTVATLGPSSLLDYWYDQFHCADLPSGGFTVRSSYSFLSLISSPNIE